VRRLLAALVLSGLALGCGGGEELELVRALESARDGDVVDLAAVAGDGWDRVGIFAEGSSAEDIEALLGIPAPARAEAQLGRDGAQLLLFARDERVVAAAEVARTTADLGGVAPVVLPRAQARLRVVVGLEGERRLEAPPPGGPGSG
jgi:hypothetical protein